MVFLEFVMFCIKFLRAVISVFRWLLGCRCVERAGGFVSRGRHGGRRRPGRASDGGSDCWSVSA